jgi:predicted TIM-barrel fold metal-dependent hydrolase
MRRPFFPLETGSAQVRRNFDLTSIRKRLRPPGPVIDVHVHPYPIPGLGGQATPKQAADYLIAQADAAGVTCMNLMNLGRSWSNTPTMAACREANDLGLAVRAVNPSRFVCFAYVNPAFPDEAVAELDRMIADGPMVGVKLWVAVRANDERVVRVVRHAARLGAPVLQHAWIKAGGNLPGESSPADVAELARDVPEARIIMGHLGGGGIKGIETVRNLPNVVVETGGSDPERGIVEEAVARLGSRRVVFGSDATGRNMAVQLGKVLGADISEIAKRRVLWNNLVALLPPSADIVPEDDAAEAPEDKVKP